MIFMLRVHGMLEKWRGKSDTISLHCIYKFINGTCRIAALACYARQ